MKSKFVVTFAGPIGSSKTPVANYLSFNFNLPVFNLDAVRTEITEDFLKFDKDELIKRRDERLKMIVSLGNSIIIDSSVDRVWDEKLEPLAKSGYEVFLISMDISKDRLLKIYEAKKYSINHEIIDNNMAEHQEFLRKHPSLVNISITDENFKDRLEICRAALEKWIQD